MNQNDQGRIELGNAEFELLAWAVPNEVINGFKVDNFERVIGTSEEQMKVIARNLRATPKKCSTSIDHQQAQVLKNALAVVLQELGEDEFQTRTGCDFEDGQKILRALNSLIETEPKANS